MKSPQTTIERRAYDSEVAKLAALVYSGIAPEYPETELRYGRSTEDRVRDAVRVARAIIVEART